ncbi:conserved hypothetical protein [Sphingomonas sp. EC-HK361]|uniref:PspC domain-containing protein n=1 Tax=Sphingomonas sp. EC-HK361 TaxID=2038397 RepID=UPI001256D0F0|nr:PspC domain-containing protein [Sphingomonas sp. EC-HK361]VVT16486.1 conserved hypothetical protein [Sphingomonas sp. EC-HK361]
MTEAPTTSAKPSLFARDDTFFGVCEAIGQDFGFNPLILRVVFGVALLINPVVVIATYLALGVAVLGSRLLFPARARSQGKAVAVAPAAATGQNDDFALEMAA